MAANLVTIRCFQPEDSVRCRTIFTEGIMGRVMPAMKIVFPAFFKVALILLVPIIAIAVKFSLWILLLLSLVVFVVMTTVIYLNIHAEFTTYVNNHLKSDLSDIGKYYEGDSCMFVAECDDRVIGMMGVAKKDHHKVGVAELQRMSVCSSARGKGIGTLLVNKAVEFCKERKYDKLTLTTLNSHHAAVALYKKCGFNIVNIKRFRNYFMPNVKELFFEKVI